MNNQAGKPGMASRMGALFSPEKPGRRDLIIACCLTALTIAAYWRVGSAEFTYYDDKQSIADNPQIRQGLTWESIRWACTTGPKGSPSHPLAWLSLMLDAQLFGVSSTVFHLTNLAIHLGNTLLLLLLFRRMTGSVWRSTMVAALFALHPLNVEAVAWVSARKDLLGTAFALAATLAYVGYALRPGLLRYVLVFVLLALGPMLIMLPLVFLLLDFWPLARVPKAGAAGQDSPGAEADGAGHMLSARGRVIAELALEKVPLLALSMLFGTMMFLEQRAIEATGAVEPIGLGTRLANALVGYAAYLGKLFRPIDLTVAYPQMSAATTLQIRVAVLVLLTVSLAVAWGALRGRRYLAVGWLWYLAVLFPVIGILQSGVQPMADRFAYVPAIGVFLIVAWGMADLATAWPSWVRAVQVVAGAALVGCLVLTHHQVEFWHDNESLFRHQLAVHPDDPAAHNNLGTLLWDQGKVHDAKAEWDEALKTLPNDPEVHNNLAAFYLQQGDLNAAAHHLETTLLSKPGMDSAHNTLGIVRWRQRRIRDAIHEFETAIDLQPDRTEARINLAKLYAQEGFLEEAETLWKKVLTLMPDDVQAANGLLEVSARLGKIQDAEAVFRKLLEARPDNIVARYSLAMALLQSGRRQEAISELHHILEIQPDNLNALNNLAWILATDPDPSLRNGAEAVSLAERAVEVSKGRSPGMLDTLAAAYAAAGRFPEAVATAEEARKGALRSDKGLAERLQTRLDLYRAGVPYREKAPPTPAP